MQLSHFASEDSGMEKGLVTCPGDTSGTRVGQADMNSWFTLETMLPADFGRTGLFMSRGGAGKPRLSPSVPPRLLEHWNDPAPALLAPPTFAHCLSKPISNASFSKMPKFSPALPLIRQCQRHAPQTPSTPVHSRRPGPAPGLALRHEQRPL